MKKIHRMLTVSAAIVMVLLLGAPDAMAQIKVNVVDAVLKEATARGWAAGAAGRFEHPIRPQADVVLAQCLQDALASGDYPEIEAAFSANKTYVEANIPKAIAFAVDPANDWNELESTFITFQLMNRGEDAEAQLRCFNAWVLEWGNALGDDTSGMDVGDIDFSAQAAVEAMFDACLAESKALDKGGAAGRGSIRIQQRHEIERECERQVYTFLRLFERDHSEVADLCTEDGSVEFPPAGPTVGREAIRERFSAVDVNDVELNVLIANNLLITVIDEDNATGFCYVTHRQHRYKDSKREGAAVLRDPWTISGWSWEFKRVEGEWKISKLVCKVVLYHELLITTESE
jgi:hypothetical protein